MNGPRLLGAVCAVSLVVLANTAHAAVVNPIYGLSIGGTLYDVTFHVGNGDTFDALWDADNDNVFGGGASAFSVAPTFWGNANGALMATEAVIAYLGQDDETDYGTDAFFVPYTADLVSQDTLTQTRNKIIGWIEADTTLTTDTLGSMSRYDDMPPDQTPYASFALSPVPAPAAVWLFGSGLLGLIGVARR